MSHTTMTSDRFSTAIWLALMALTGATFWVGEAGLAGPGIMLALLLIALVKGQMVAHYFMGLRQAHLGWRLLILGFFAVVGGFIALAYVMALH